MLLIVMLLLKLIFQILSFNSQLEKILDKKPSHHHKLCTVPPASLLDELNYFYARVDQGNKEVAIKVHLPPGDLPLSLSTSDAG